MLVSEFRHVKLNVFTMEPAGGHMLDKIWRNDEFDTGLSGL